MSSTPWFDLETPHEIVRVKPGGIYIVRVPGEHVYDVQEKLHDITHRACRGQNWDPLPLFVVLPKDVALDKLERPVLEKLARAAGLLPPPGDIPF